MVVSVRGPMEADPPRGAVPRVVGYPVAQKTIVVLEADARGLEAPEARASRMEFEDLDLEVTTMSSRSGTAGPFHQKHRPQPQQLTERR